MKHTFLNLTLLRFLFTIYFNIIAHNAAKYIYDNNFCLVYLGITDEFCRANEICSNYGKSVRQSATLVGGKFFQTMNYTINIPQSFWTSINQIELMNENIVGYENWKNVAYYDHNKKTLQITHSKREDPIAVICELGSSKTCNASYDEEFLVIKTFQRYLYQNDKRLFANNPYFYGCSLHNGNKSRLECAYSCMYGDRCSLFFHNKITGTCVLTRYVRSSMPLNYSSEKGEWSGYLVV
ncbi:unnamed protein product [Heterobilharzia americana]|nr:unnamed protein product [Heterobilharzia americana]